jgi:hypothetical protein
MEIFRFQAPVRRNRIFNAPTCGPTDITRGRYSESADRAGERATARGDPHIVERVVLLGKSNATDAPPLPPITAYLCEGGIGMR